MTIFPISLPEKYRIKAEKLSINPDQVSEQFIRGGGKGGQKINKTSSRVQLRYVPMGIDIRCQTYREQSKNRLAAWKMLIDKVEERVLGRESAMAKARYKLIKQKKRRSRKAKEKILALKKERSAVKSNRGNLTRHIDTG